MPRRKDPIKTQIRAAKRAIREAEKALASLTSLVRSYKSTGETKSRKLNLSPQRKAVLKLQGQYMGYMRQLGPRQKAQVKALKEKKGFKPAIAAARKLAGK